MTLVRSLARHLETGALDELTLTTNGTQLARFADDLAAAGVRRINVSLDTLDPAKFARDHPLGQARPGAGRASTPPSAPAFGSRSTPSRSRASTTTSSTS